MARVCFRTLGVGRVHQPDRCALHLHLCRVLDQKVAVFEVAVAIPAQNHIRGGNRKHVALQLLLLDVLSLLVTVGHGKHLVHSGNQESRRAARRVEHYVVRLDVNQITHKVSDVARRQDDAQRLPVAARIAHELAVEAPDEVLGGLLVLDVLKHMLIEELRIELQRRLTQRVVYLVQSEAGLQDGELRKELVLLRVWPNVRAGQACLDGVHQLVAVTIIRNLVSCQGIEAESPVVKLIQRQQNTSDNQWLVLVFQRSVSTQIFVKLSSVLENLFRRLFNIGSLFQNIPRVVLVDVALREPDERFNVR